MSPDVASAQRARVRRGAGWALVGGLCAAALTAVVAIASGDFGGTDLRVIATSLGFAVFSATAATGMTLRLRDDVRLRWLGEGTAAASALAFLLLVAALWQEGDALWRWFGALALAAFAASHASLVTGARRPSDDPAIRLIGTTSIVLAVVDAAFGIAAVSGAVEDVDDGLAKLVAVLVVLLLLTTFLPPILRRIDRASGPRSAERADGLAAEAIASADRIEALSAGPGDRSPEIRRECERLRELARSHR